MDFQAVVLAGGSGDRFGNITSEDVPKALLPVGNKALLSYPLDMLKRAGFAEVIVVAMGEGTSKCIQKYVDAHYSGTGFQVQVVGVPDQMRSADALRHIADQLKCSDFLLMSGDLLTTVPVVELVGLHCMRQAVATALLGKRRDTTDPETGKPAAPLDYIGLDSSNQRLVFCAPGSMIAQEIKVRRSMLRANGAVTLRTDLMDTHLYLFSRDVLNTLDKHPNIKSIKGHLLPYLARRQTGSPVVASRRTSSVSGPPEDSPAGAGSPFRGPEAAEPIQESVAPSPLESRKREGVYVSVRDDKYCQRVTGILAYCEANREVVSMSGAAALLGSPLSPYDNVVDKSAELGSRTTVGAGCIVGAGCRLGDKCSIKRTVLGKDCRFGNNVKVINSVIGDGVVLEDGCHVQGSVICAKSVLQERCSLRDCQVAVGCTVGAGEEHRAQQLPE